MALMMESHALQLQRIDKNPGVLLMKQGQASLTNDNWTVIKVLNLSTIQEELEFNINRYTNLNQHIKPYLINKVSNFQLLNVKTQTDYVINSTIDRFKQLVPSVRIKRGILNPLGSIIKIITGNLDYEDAMKYDKLIKSIKTRQDTVTEKITMISDITKKIVKITNATYNNFVHIDKELWELRRLINVTKTDLAIQHFINIYNLFLHNFQLLFSRLDDIETCITFSKLGTLHQSLVNSDELVKLLRNVEKTNRLVYPVSYDNLVKIENCIELKAYSVGSQITFILEIPLVKDGKYTYYKTIPIPITDPFNQTKIVIPKYPYLLVKGLDIVLLSQPCSQLHDEAYLCREEESQMPLEDSCITALVKYSYNTSSCHQVTVEINTVKIEPVGKHRWIIYSKAENILTKICSNEVINDNIKGTYLLTLDDYCDVKIGEITIKSHHLTTSTLEFGKLPIINLPEVIETDTQKQREPINLDNSDLTNLQHLNNLLTMSEIKETKQKKGINVESVSLATLILYVILILSICIFVMFKYNLFKFLYRNDQSDKNLTDNFESKGGGVMHPGPSSGITITSC